MAANMHGLATCSKQHGCRASPGHKQAKAGIEIASEASRWAASGHSHHCLRSCTRQPQQHQWQQLQMSSCGGGSACSWCNGTAMPVHNPQPTEQPPSHPPDPCAPIPLGPESIIASLLPCAVVVASTAILGASHTCMGAASSQQHSCIVASPQHVKGVTGIEMAFSTRRLCSSRMPACELHVLTL